MNDSDKKALLNLARESIDSYFSSSEPNISQIKHLNAKEGVFVTLHKNSNLRGCIGFIESDKPLFKSIINAARSAAFQDNRFSPVSKDELPNLHIEISVLSIPRIILVNSPDEYLNKITIGADGLILRHKKGYSGLLLPQVATEWNFTITAFLEALSEKSGLPKNAWQTGDVNLYKFQAEIFSEEKS